ncbi:uncharacterized protein LOC128213105 [Mya arenaria]|nr:uncharacterized protein LOC128213105 [Mya arenaria]
MAYGGSSMYKGSDLIHDYSCSKCEEDDLNTEAQHFCPQCENYLCDKCVTRHGSYYKKHTVFGRGDIQKWAGFFIDRCDKHRDKLNVHCDDHQELCCSVCVTLDHRLCSKFSHLDDLARGFLNTADFKLLPAAVDNIRSKLDQLMNAGKKDQISLKDSYEKIIAEIKAHRKEINMILDQIEKKTVQQLDSLMKDLEQCAKDDLETCAKMNDQLKDMVDKLNQITCNQKKTNSYIGFRKCQTMLKEVTTVMQEIQGRPKEGLRFKSDESVLPFLRNSLGNVEQSIFKTKDAIHVHKAKWQSNYSVKIKKDANNCYILGMCALPSGEVIIADFNNRVILLNQQYNVIDHLDMSSLPYDLCYIYGNEVAVAAYDAVAGNADVLNGVQFLTVTKGQLQAVRNFNTGHRCRSIIYHQGHLYVGSNDALYLYTMDGHMINKIYEDKAGGRTVYKCAISPDGERIYVTNNRAHNLVTLDKFGKVLSTLKDPELRQPAGLCVSPSGHVFVCGCDSNTVLQVDREGQKKLATLVREVDGLCKPVSVWFNHTSSLVVGNSGSDIILVFKLC